MHCGSSESDRRAITLLEVLLVLALLVILSAMTWPALDRPMANQRLRKAADQVRTAWTRARVEAMTTGQTFAFRCTIGENRFEIAAQAGPEAVDVPPADQAAPAAASRRHTLPEDVRFAGGQTLFDGQLSEPILFYPDGTTSTATLILENRHQRQIEISLRGLTGVMTVGEPRAAEDGNAVQE
jgi:Tfp pilus assembly protein FimT